MTCKWKQDEDGNYFTDCDNGFYFDNTDMPKDFIYCPYCGKLIEGIKYKENLWA